MKVYIAGGWFTPEQRKARDELIKVCASLAIPYYSPEHDMLFTPGDDAHKVFRENCVQILMTDFVLASTVDKDMGTIFECGYAFRSGKPIIYYCPGLDGPFNLMLAESSHATFTDIKDLLTYLEEGIKLNEFKPVVYKGELE